MKDIFKFEYLFAFATLLILAVALFVFKADKDTVNIIITAIVSALSAITAFFFTKTQVREPKEERKDDFIKVINPTGTITNDIK